MDSQGIERRKMERREPREERRAGSGAEARGGSAGNGRERGRRSDSKVFFPSPQQIHATGQYASKG